MAAGRSSQGDGGGTVPRQEAQELHNFGAEPAANFRANDLFFFQLVPITHRPLQHGAKQTSPSLHTSIFTSPHSGS